MLPNKEIKDSIEANWVTGYYEMCVTSLLLPVTLKHSGVV